MEQYDNFIKGSHMNQKLKSLFLFLLTFGLGFSIYYTNMQNWNLSQRDPASINTKISHLNNYDHDQLKSELLHSFQITYLDSGDKAIRFQNISSQVCKTYQKINLDFIADGMTVSGEPTEFKIEADCIPAQDPAELASIIIPIKRLLSMKAQNAVFKFNNETTTYTFNNTGDVWPQVWILKNISFRSHSGQLKTVELDIVGQNLDNLKVLEF